MQCIWISEMELVPSGSLTFRRKPSGLLHIMTYPFIPPTTMSGFLKRLMDIAEGNDWTGYGKDWFDNKEGSGFTLTLNSSYRSLGAYPETNKWQIHKTRRHGPKNFKHKEFSELIRRNHNQNYQLHHWDYLFCDKLYGWVAAKDPKLLERLQKMQNFGGKCGKEGYVTLKKVSRPRELMLTQGTFQPLGLVPYPFRPTNGTFYSLYAHHWNKDYTWTNGEKGGVDGFVQISTWWMADKVEGPYWAVDKGLGFPANAVDCFLQGDRESFWQGEGT